MNSFKKRLWTLTAIFAAAVLLTGCVTKGSAEKAPLKPAQDEIERQAETERDEALRQVEAEAERKAEAARIAALRQAEAIRKAEAARQAEAERLEALRQAEAKRAEAAYIEALRQAEVERRLEALRQAEAARQAEAERFETLRQTEALQQVKAERLDALRQTEAARQAETERIEVPRQTEAVRAEVLRQAEAERRTAALRQAEAEAARQAEMARQAEAGRQAEIARSSLVPPAQRTQTPSRRIAEAGIKSETQLTAFFLAHNPRETASRVWRMASYYIEEAAKEGINSDIAFVQMCLETGFLDFGGTRGLVTADMHNYCGLGAVDGSQRGAGARFSTEQLGVRAHIQHLQAYALVTPLNGVLIDPRYDLVKPHGKAPDIFGLAGTWASDKAYGQKLDTLLKELAKY